MRIFIAGAAGAVGRRLVPMLVARGHEVAGTTRAAAKAGAVHDLGAEPVVLDALDRDAVLAAVAAAKPDVVVHQLTALSGPVNMRRFDRHFAETNRLRTEGTDHLLTAARAAGARRFVVQSYTGWSNERTGGPVKTEADPIDLHPAAPAKETMAAIRRLESTVAATTDVAGVALRYGSFYGPGTQIGAGGELLTMIRRRRLPIVGGGTGVWSFVHIDDVAAATVLAIEGDVIGLYNVVDDEPAPVHEWLPYLAEAIGAKPPRRVPAWLVRPMLGELAIAVMTSIRGSANARARRDLGWEPRYSSWRQGFRDGLG